MHERLDRRLVIVSGARLGSFVFAISLLCGCGGGGGGSAPAGPNPPAGGWTPGVYQPAARFEAQCAAPRSGIDPDTGIAYPDLQGSVLSENNWLRSWSNDLYLWYDEIPDRDPALSTTTADYFKLLKTAAKTPSGNDKDRFHFSYATDVWRMLSQSGVSSGYGAEWVLLSSTPPREVRVAYTEPGSPAATAPANLARGARVAAIDGVDIDANTQAGIDTLNAGLFPSQAGESHTFVVEDNGSNVTRTFTMQSADVTRVPVQNTHVEATATGAVGYLLFNDHLATAEQALIDAIASLQTSGIDDLVLDIRYNGGGYLIIASQLAYMIAGPSSSGGRSFEQIQFIAKHPSTDPVTGDPLQPIPFVATTIGYSAPQPGVPLPTLNLSRVFLLTGSGTCSASESIINSLRGIDVEVIQIGSSTCGKPYGFYPTDNCGTTYFTIQFRGINEKGFGDYTDGFSPANSLGIGTAVPGCSVADDLAHPLGDPAEARFAAALAYRDNGICPAPSGIAPPGALKPGTQVPSDGRLVKPVWLENRVLSSPL